MTAPVTTQWTVDALQALPGGGLEFEVVDGQRYRLAFHTASHENAIALLSHLLTDHLGRHSVAQFRRAPTQLVIGARTLLRPDVIVLPAANSAPPLLVVEVLSPATATIDRGPKRILYQELGVGELWLLDLDQEMVERWRTTAEAAEIVRDRLVWRADPAAIPFELFLPAFFGEVHLED